MLSYGVEFATVYRRMYKNVLSQIYDVIQSDVALHLQVH